MVFFFLQKKKKERKKENKTHYKEAKQGFHVKKQ